MVQGLRWWRLTLSFSRQVIFQHYGSIYLCIRNWKDKVFFRSFKRFALRDTTSEHTVRVFLPDSSGISFSRYVSVYLWWFLLFIKLSKWPFSLMLFLYVSMVWASFFWGLRSQTGQVGYSSSLKQQLISESSWDLPTSLVTVTPPRILLNSLLFLAGWKLHFFLSLRNSILQEYLPNCATGLHSNGWDESCVLIERLPPQAIVFERSRWEGVPITLLEEDSRTRHLLF